MPYIAPFVRNHPEYQPLWDNYPWPENTFYHSRVLMAQIAWSLKMQGNIEDANSTRVLIARLESMGVELPMGQKAFSEVLTAMASTPFDFLQVIRYGKRTRSIRLRPDAYLPPNPFELAALAEAKKLRTDPKGNGAPTPQPAPEPLPERPRPQPKPEPQPAVSPPAPEAVGHPVEAELVEASPLGVFPLGDIPLSEKATLLMRLAGEVLVETTMLEAARTPVAETVDASQAEHLATALEENQRLRAQLQKASQRASAAEQTAAAHKAARQAQATRVAILEENLRKALQGDRVPDTSGFRAIDQLMRERPTAKAS